MVATAKSIQNEVDLIEDPATGQLTPGRWAGWPTWPGGPAGFRYRSWCRRCPCSWSTRRTWGAP